MPKTAKTEQKLGAPLFGSALVHSIAILLLITGLPFFAPKPPPPIVMSVEIVSPQKPKEKPAKQRPIPTPPKSTSKPKPKTPKAQPIPAPPSAKPKPPPKPKAAPKPKSKPKSPRPKEDKDEFSSLLKNLAPDASPKVAQDDGKDKTVSNSEMAALTKQLKQCWNIVGGARYAETLSVEINITVNRDRTIAKSTVVDKARYNSDPAFRAAADSAMRALRHPRCTPLDLPPEKYDAWKNITFNFDPRSVL